MIFIRLATGQPYSSISPYKVREYLCAMIAMIMKQWSICLPLNETLINIDCEDILTSTLFTG